MIASDDSISLSVEGLPRSLNNLYATGPHGRRYKDPRAKEFLALLAIQTRGARLEGEAFSLSMLLQFPNDGRRHDTSNYCKHAEDCLVELGVIPDDNLIIEHVLRKTYGEKPLTQLVITRLA